VLQATWNEVQAKSANGLGLSTQGLGTAASFEAGMPFDVGGGVVVEPQAQVVYQHIGLDKAHDQAAGVDFGAIDSLQTRLGARVAKTWSKSEQLPVTAWVRPSVVKEFKGNPTTSFSTSTQGEVDFSSDMRGTSLKLDGGVEGQLTESISVNTKVGYEWGISSNTDGDGYSAQVGLTVKF
jgi:outer membrane autotransporter protein